jgi:hypothetical protein
MSELELLRSRLCRPFLSLDACRQEALARGWRPFTVSVLIVPPVLHERMFGEVPHRESVTVWGQTEAEALRESGIS